MYIDLEIKSPLLARSALIIYADDDGARGHIMRHALDVRDGQLHMAEGHNVTRSTIDTLLSLNAQSTLTIIPAHVVAFAQDSVAWVQERTEKRLLFQGAYDPAVAALDGQCFAQPRLLFIARRNHMYVYALPGHERPDAHTLLYAAPYFNIFDNHQVCNGSITRPARVTPQNTAEWSEAFFYSNFVKPSGSTKRWQRSGTYRELWDAVRACGEFKEEWLAPTTLTFAQAIGQA